MRKIWDDDAWDDYLWWQSQDRKTLKRINRLIKDIERSAREPGSQRIGKAGHLGYSRLGLLSMRIDASNRLVYKIDNDSLLIISCRGHYE